MAFLLFGSLWFWLACIVATVLVIVATEKGSGIGATATLLITMALLFFFGNKVPFSDFFSYVSGHPWITLAGVIGYILWGVGWAVLKWYFFLIKERDKCAEEHYHHDTVSIPRVIDHKSEILVWMWYWPFSALWTVLDQPLKKIYLFIYSKIKARMQLMADKIFEPLTRSQRDMAEKRKKDRINGTRE